MALPSLPVLYSTPRADVMADFVAAHYGLPGSDRMHVAAPRLQRHLRGEGQDGRGRLILRLSGVGVRAGESDVASEAAFIAHLDKESIPVAAAGAEPDGNLFTMVVLSRGTASRGPVQIRRGACAAAQNSAAERAGARRDLGANPRCRGRIRSAAVLGGRYRLDLDHLLHRPVSAVLALARWRRPTRRDSPNWRSACRAAVAGARDGLGWTRCHGDCHGFQRAHRGGRTRAPDRRPSSTSTTAVPATLPMISRYSCGRASRFSARSTRCGTPSSKATARSGVSPKRTSKPRTCSCRSGISG